VVGGDAKSSTKSEKDSVNKRRTKGKLRGAEGDTEFSKAIKLFTLALQKWFDLARHGEGFACLREISGVGTGETDRAKACRR